MSWPAQEYREQGFMQIGGSGASAIAESLAFRHRWQLPELPLRGPRRTVHAARHDELDRVARSVSWPYFIEVALCVQNQPQLTGTAAT